MHGSIERLLRVQDFDSQILFLREAKRVRPRELDEDRQKVAQERAGVEVIRGAIKDLRVAADSLEVDVRQYDAEVNKIKGARNQCKSNAEYQVMTDQIERQIEERGKAEEDVLAKLSEIDDLQERLELAETSQRKAEEILARKEAEMAELLKGLDGQLSQLETERAQHTEGIDREHLALYERVLDRHQNFAIAEVQDGICRGCHMRLTPQNVNQLMLGEIVQCSQCTRFLYLAD